MNFQQHMLEHGEKKHICHHCGGAYALADTLRIHILNMHTPKEELEFGCSHCDKRYVSCRLLLARGSRFG